MAAIAVAVSHFRGAFAIDLPNAGLAVDFFFALSGFVIAHAYERRLETGELSAGEFAKLRIIRLYPLYALGAALGALALALGMLWSPITGSASLALICAVMMAPAFGLSSHLYMLNPPSWSLFFELIANIGYGYCHRRLRSLTVLVAAIVVMAALLVIAGIMRESLDFGWQSGKRFIGGFLRVGFSFLVGLLLYRLYRSRPASFRMSPWVPGLILLVVLFADLGPALLLTYQLVAVLVLFPALLWVASGIETKPSDRPMLVALGTASYPLYAIHYPLYMLADGTADRVGLDLDAWAPASGIILLALIFGLSLLVYRIFDVPVRRALARYFLASRRQDKAVAVGS